jgi:adenosine deaminase
VALVTQPAPITPDLTEAWVRALPKAELHVHLDGSLRPETMLELAAEVGVPMPASDPETLARVMCADDATDLVAYLSCFATTLSVLQTREALIRVTDELVTDHAAEGVEYVEIRYAPNLNTERGLSMEQVLHATLEGMEAGMARSGIRAQLILCGIRSMDPAIARQIAELAVAHRSAGVCAFDLAGAEAGYPARHHAEACRIAAEGLLPITLHAGEAWGAASIRDALVAGRALRIGHGTRLEEDPDLLAWVRDRRIPLEICLTSNVQTRVAPTFEAHPVRRYVEAGIQLTLCTDNRLVSGTTVTEEYLRAARHLGFTKAELVRIARMGFESAFLPAPDKAALLDKLAPRFEGALAE